MRVFLRVVPAEGKPFEHEFVGESLIIGRSSSSDLVIRDRYLSRQHTRIFRQGNLIMVEDLGSLNGTMLDGKRLEKPRPLKDGAVIRISESFLSLIAGKGGETSPPSDGDERDTPHNQSIIIKVDEFLEDESLRMPSDIASPDELRRYAERLALLNDIHKALGRSISLKDLWNLILARIFKMLKPEDAAIYLRAEGGKLKRVARRSSMAEPPPFSSSLAAEVLEKGNAVLVFDVAKDERFNEAQSIAISGIKSIMAAPMPDSEGALGMILLRSNQENRIFTEEDMELLVSIAAIAAMRVRNLALTEEASERKRLQRELELARHIQLQLIPSKLPTVKGYELFGENTACESVSGDYFEIDTRKEGRELCFMVADVSGKGVSASLMTTAVEALAAGPIEDGLPPEIIFTKLARQLHRRTPKERYATAFLGAIDLETHTLRFANAGHAPALLFRNDGAVDKLERTGMPLGLMADAHYKVANVQVNPGDVLVVYTDGVTETFDSEYREFGEKRLLAHFVKYGSKPLAEIVTLLGHALDTHAAGAALHDDRTILLIRRQG